MEGFSQFHLRKPFLIPEFKKIYTRQTGVVPERSMN
jgi:hypothetical protein